MGNRVTEEANKDKWDKMKIILNATGSLLIPIVIVIVGIIGSRVINEAQLKASVNIAQAQLESSKQIAESQLVKDYVSMLAQAASKEHDKELIFIIQSLNGLDEVPDPIRAILAEIKKQTRSKEVLQAVDNISLRVELH